MNLAIIIGVSKYDNLASLQQCKNDANVINKIIELSEKYEEILYINDKNKTKSGAILNQIDEFVNKHKGKSINEILFYFSGHGITKDEEFHYCTTNTSLEKLNSSSITNSNLDQTLKVLKPQIYVKIIDACESGTRYIKGMNDRKSILENKTESFNSCYFFCSSQYNQDSRTSTKFSDFTLSIFEIIKEQYSQNIEFLKYRDLSNLLADMYQDNNIQKPFFIQQGSLSDIFININPKIILELDKQLKNMETQSGEEKQNIENIDETIAKEQKEQLLYKIENKLQRVTIFLKKYKYKLKDNVSEDEIVSRKQVCEWIGLNKEKYFVFANQVTKKELKPEKRFPIVMFHTEDDYGYITDDYEVNVDKDNYKKSFDYISELKGFPKLKCQIVSIYSLTKLYLIYNFGSSTPESWDSFSKYKTKEKNRIKVISFNEMDEKSEQIGKEISDEFKSFCDEYISKYIDAIM